MHFACLQMPAGPQAGRCTAADVQRPLQLPLHVPVRGEAQRGLWRWIGGALNAPSTPTSSIPDGSLLCCSVLLGCRGPAVLRSPPPVVAALLEGLPVGASAASQQISGVLGALEDGNAELLHQAAPLVLEMLAGDALAADVAQVRAGRGGAL